MHAAMTVPCWWVNVLSKIPMSRNFRDIAEPSTPQGYCAIWGVKLLIVAYYRTCWRAVDQGKIVFVKKGPTISMHPRKVVMANKNFSWLKWVLRVHVTWHELSDEARNTVPANFRQPASIGKNVFNHFSELLHGVHKLGPGCHEEGECLTSHLLWYTSVLNSMKQHLCHLLKA